MIISGIYKIQSIIKPERCYIGSAVNIQKRWRDHKRELRNNKHSNKKLQNHCNKYGESISANGLAQYSHYMKHQREKDKSIKQE